VTAAAPHQRPARHSVAFQRSVLTVVALAALAIAVVGFYQYQAYYVDDAFISLRYCRNLIEGNGLTWNPGERIEGYSNFLYIILTAAVGRLGIDLIAASRVVGIAAYIILALFIILRVWRRAGREPDTTSALTIPLVISVSSLPIIIWSLGGLEASLFALFVTAGIWLFADAIENGRSPVAAGALFALAAMTRPEGVFFFLGAVTFGLLSRISARRIRISAIIRMAALFIVIFGVYYLWRFIYYGDPLPNTYYAKSGFYAGKAFLGYVYMVKFFMAAPFILAIMLFEVVHTTIDRRWTLAISFLVTMTVGYLGYVIAIGGDHMSGFRFVAPIIPTCALAVYYMLRPVAASLPRYVGLLMPAGVLFLSAYQLVEPGPHTGAARQIDPTVFVGRIIARQIVADWPPGSLIALNTAGSVPYYAPQNRYIDMLGLVDTVIARREVSSRKTLPRERVPGHEKGDGRYVVSRRPDYIILGPTWGQPSWSPYFRSDAEIAGSQEFRRGYKKYEVPIDVTVYPDYARYRATRKGKLTFTYYQRSPDP